MFKTVHNINKHFIFLCAVIIYFTTSFYSNGFYSYDEHFQIIEFANSKIETYSDNELPFEFYQKMRPTLQPSIGYVIIKTLQYLGVSDSYSQITFLRFLTTLLALLSIRLFIKNTEKLITNEKLKISYHLLSYFLWFLPFLSCRFSSETWAGLLFLIGLALVFKNKNNPIIIGFCLAFSFFFRYQMAFSIIGLISWLLFIRTISWQYFIKLSLSFLVVIIVNVLIDSWFYNQFVFTPWNYFNVNVIDDFASRFGIRPWYYYFLKIILSPGFVTGIPMLFSIIILLFYKPKNLILWCVITFIFFHALVPHKEDRFLFPILYLFPICMMLAYEIIIKKFKLIIGISFVKYISLVLFVISNIIGLYAMSQKSNGYGYLSIAKYLHDNTKNKNAHFIYCSGANPYDPWHTRKLRFYVEKNISEKRIQNLCEFNDYLIKKGTINYLGICKEDLYHSSCQEYLQQNNFVLVAQSTPEWIDYLRNNYLRFYAVNESTILLYQHKTNSEIQNFIE